MESDVLLDRRLAFAFLRFTLGLNPLMHGAVRLPILSAFVAGLVKEFAKTPLPVVVVRHSLTAFLSRRDSWAFLCPCLEPRGRARSPELRCLTRSPGGDSERFSAAGHGARPLRRPKILSRNGDSRP
jgi:hypothetical protein